MGRLRIIKSVPGPLPGAVACCLYLAAGVFAAQAQTAGYPCEAPAAVQQELSKLDFPNAAAMTADQRYAESQAIFSALLARYPDNLFVQTRYQDFKARALEVAGAEVEPLIKEYQALLAKHPEDPKYLYLYGRTLVGVRTPEAEAFLEKALARAPNFAWPHLKLARIYELGRYRDPAKSKTHLDAFMKLCPASLEPYRYLRELDDKQFLRQSAERLRKLLEKRSHESALEAYGTLWDLDFRTAPTSEYAQARERVAADVARLRALNLVSSLNWYDALHYGYKVLGDEQGQKWVEAHLLNDFPQSTLAVQLVMGRWQQENPRPPEGSAPEELEAYNQALYHATQDWIRRWPDAPMPRVERFQALIQIKDAPAADVKAAAEGFMTALEKNQDMMSVSPPAPMQVAKEYVKRGIELASVPQLIDSAYTQSLKHAKQMSQSDMAPPEFQKFASNERNFGRWDGLTILSDAYMKMNQPEKARDVLFQMETFLGEHKPDKSATEGTRHTFIDESRNFWEKMASLAEAQNRKLDALAYYQNALAFPHQHSGEDKKDDDPGKMARQLWRALGGTDEGWLAWIAEHAPTAAAAAEEGAWTKRGKPLPDFNLSGLDGRSWRLVDLKGKVTFLNVWSTSCGPCRAELPFVEKLYENMKARPDVLVLTLDTDENPGLIEPFMREHKYTFPVIPARSYVEQLNPILVIPQNWVVDRNGVLWMEQTGYGYKGDEWVTEAAKTIEKARETP